MYDNLAVQNLSSQEDTYFPVVSITLLGLLVEITSICVSLYQAGTFLFPPQIGMYFYSASISPCLSLHALSFQLSSPFFQHLQKPPHPCAAPAATYHRCFQKEHAVIPDLAGLGSQVRLFYHLMLTAALHTTRRSCGGEDNAVFKEAQGQPNPEVQPVDTKLLLKRPLWIGLHVWWEPAKLQPSL